MLKIHCSDLQNLLHRGMTIVVSNAVYIFFAVFTLYTADDITYKHAVEFLCVHVFGTFKLNRMTPRIIRLNILIK